MMIRAMTPEEEASLALAVQLRDIGGIDRAVYAAQAQGLPADLINLVRAGLTYEEVHRTRLGEDIAFGEGEYRYVWTLPTEKGGIH